MSTFAGVLAEIKALHDAKNKDYSPGDQDYRNMRAGESWGIDAWKMPLLRVEEKLARLRTYARGNTLQNESVEDSMLDIMVLAGISVILFRQGAAAGVNDTPATSARNPTYTQYAQAVQEFLNASHT
jgi:hypothetical protein